MASDSPAIPFLSRVCLIAALMLSGAARAAIVIPMSPPQVWLVQGNTIYVPAAALPRQVVLHPANNPVIIVRRPAPAASCADRLAAPGTLLNWMDVQHCRLSVHSLETVNWFDHLFGTGETEQASVLLRVVSEEVVDNKIGDQFALNVLASVRLPNADQHLRLVISDDRQDFAEISKNISPEQQRLQSAAATAALRFLALTEGALRLDTDVGLRAGPDLFVRGRVRDSWSLTPNAVLRAAQTVRYAVEDEGRTISELDLDRILGGGATVSLDSQFTWWEKEDHEVGARWNQGVAYKLDEGRDQNWSCGIGTEGVTRPVWERESYGVWTLWRRLLWSNWIYYEVEPRLTRYRQYDWSVDPSITLRLELQFGHK